MTPEQAERLLAVLGRIHVDMETRLRALTEAVHDLAVYSSHLTSP